MIKSGLAFYVHHDKRIEFCYDYDERVRVIEVLKPIEEQELRLRLLQIIPHDKLPQKGLEALDKSREAYDIAWEAYDKVYKDYYSGKYDEKRKDYIQARENFDMAMEDYIAKNKKALEKLHSELCPNCPFDNKTIFTRKDKAGKWY